MKVLMISLDNSILDADSASASRMMDYGAICDELHIIILGKEGNNIKLTGNVFIHPTRDARLFSLFSAKKIGSKILSEGGKWIITAQDPFETGLVGWCLAKKFKAGLEVQMHGDFYGNNYWKKEKAINTFRFYFGKFILKRANSVRAVSERIKKSIEKINNKIEVAPIFTDLSRVPENFVKNKKSDGFTVLSVGSLVPVKNHKQLIEVFAEIVKNIPEAKLIIAGEGPERKNYELQITNYKLQQNVRLAGHQNDLSDFYFSADIFVHASLYEGWGRAVVEAAQFGLPIVMADVGLAGEVIKNNESGIVVPVNDKEALKNAILRLAKDEMLRKRLGEGAKRAVFDLLKKEQFLRIIKENWENLAKN